MCDACLTRTCQHGDLVWNRTQYPKQQLLENMLLILLLSFGKEPIQGAIQRNAIRSCISHAKDAFPLAARRFHPPAIGTYLGT